MKFRNAVADIVYVITFVQWCWIIGAIGHDKFGFIGGILGALTGAATYFLAWVVAWYIKPPSQSLWFYGLLAVAVESFFIPGFGKDRR